MNRDIFKTSPNIHLLDLDKIFIIVDKYEEINKNREKNKKNRIEKLATNFDYKIAEIDHLQDDVKITQIENKTVEKPMHKKEREKFNILQKEQRVYEKRRNAVEKSKNIISEKVKSATMDSNKIVYNIKKELDETYEMYEFRKKYIEERKNQFNIAELDMYSKISRNEKFLNCKYE